MSSLRPVPTSGEWFAVLTIKFAAAVPTLITGGAVALTGATLFELRLIVGLGSFRWTTRDIKGDELNVAPLDPQAGCRKPVSFYELANQIFLTLDIAAARLGKFGWNDIHAFDCHISIGNFVLRAWLCDQPNHHPQLD